MTIARTFFYHTIYGIWAFLMCFAFLPSLILPLSASKLIARFWTNSVYFLLSKICNLTHNIEGKELLPEGPVIIAAKHQSAWDTLIFPLELECPTIILKRELFWLPFFGWYAKKYGAIGIKRNGGASTIRKLIRDARGPVLNGRSIVIFPEGTRTAPGQKGFYHSGVAALYKDLKIPVVPVALNSGLFWPRRKLIRRSGIITLRFLTPIPPGLSRQELMARLEAEIENAQQEICNFKYSK
jgi:1-acyl-sn-glycerol-3-phosphate acyltransferase